MEVAGKVFPSAPHPNLSLPVSFPLPLLLSLPFSICLSLTHTILSLSVPLQSVSWAPPSFCRPLSHSLLAFLTSPRQFPLLHCPFCPLHPPTPWFPEVCMGLPCSRCCNSDLNPWGALWSDGAGQRPLGRDPPVFGIYLKLLKGDCPGPAQSDSSTHTSHTPPPPTSCRNQSSLCSKGLNHGPYLHLSLSGLRSPPTSFLRATTMLKIGILSPSSQMEPSNPNSNGRERHRPKGRGKTPG